MLPTPGASNNANGQSSPDNNQVNPSRSVLTGQKKRNREAIGEGIKKPSQLQLTREPPNVGEESLEVLIMVKEKHWDRLRNYPEVSATVRQIEEKWPLLSNLQKIKENMKQNLAEFKAGCLMEVDAKQKLLQVKKELNHIDQQLQLYSTGELDLGNFLEVGGQCTEMNDVTIPINQDHGSLLAREMFNCNYRSWQSGLFNKDNNSVEVAHFHGLQEALDKTRCGETPDYLKRIATQIEVDRRKATKFGHKNIEILVCAAIKEMEDWRTPKDSGYNQLKKWAATLNMGKEQDFEVKFADDMLKNICLASFAYSMIYGEDGSVHNVASGRV
ncbi:hypothetical protein CXB51_029540 [Gossypium anomalum]|uniref:Uncharacterized protein n=1 Tax=Gossypium anomalum TaxID=47600 RepID=A0A8J6CRI1_9ROSI|nr:hypothetical protein CXB51_029540 [Gossypium anomalum]